MQDLSLEIVRDLYSEPLERGELQGAKALIVAILDAEIEYRNSHQLLIDELETARTNCAEADASGATSRAVVDIAFQALAQADHDYPGMVGDLTAQVTQIGAHEFEALCAARRILAQRLAS